MRLTPHQLSSIQNVFKTIFLPTDNMWLFGSRVDDNKKGGDIDLYIETQYDNDAIIATKKIQFLVELKKKIGEQKIDVIINPIPLTRMLPIYQEARQHGVLLK
jgi:hypothetical protein